MDSALKKIWLIAAGLFVGMVLLGSWWLRPRPQVEQASPAPVQNLAAASSTRETIEASGRILGIAIGSSVEEAREMWSPLRLPLDYTPDAKELSGRRILWRLRGTEYEWIMTWAGGDGRITRLRAFYRPENAKPFAEIGDLQRAVAVSSNLAKWNLRLPAGPNFRLVAQGIEQRAQSVYMFALQFPGEPMEGSVPDAEETD